MFLRSVRNWLFCCCASILIIRDLIGLADRLCAPTDLLFNGYPVLSRGYSDRGMTLIPQPPPPLYSAEVKKVWRSASTTLHTFVAWTGKNSPFRYLTLYYSLSSVDYYSPVLGSEIPPEFRSHCTSLRSLLISSPLSRPVSSNNFVLSGFLTRIVCGFLVFLFMSQRPLVLILCGFKTATLVVD